MLRSDICDHPADNGAALGENATRTNPIAPDGTPEAGRLYVVPARQGRAVRLAAGQFITVINPGGTQVCDFWAFSAANPFEFLSWPHARAHLSRAVPRPGDPLVTNRRRPILTLTADDSPGVHDTLIAACDLFRYTGLGCTDYHDNCADNMRMALAAIGLTAREVPQPFNIWMNIPVGSDWSLDWLPAVCDPGAAVTMRAEMDLVAVLSACPQDMIPINGAEMAPAEVHFRVEG
ncbi:MAG: DUF1989 domain-containing protein [Rubrimonas sp.]